MSAIVVLSVLFSAVLGVPPTLHCPTGAFVAPVDAAVNEGFSLPAGPYGAGNRGLEYRTRVGSEVRAIGAGTVSFAGTIAGERYVSVAHADRYLSSYSYLATIEVAKGDRVVAGQRLGTTSWRFQLGLRRDGAYLDPAPLLTVPARVRLVGDDVPPPCAGVAGPGASRLRRATALSAPGTAPPIQRTARPPRGRRAAVFGAAAPAPGPPDQPDPGGVGADSARVFRVYPPTSGRRQLRSPSGASAAPERNRRSLSTCPSSP